LGGILENTAKSTVCTSLALACLVVSAPLAAQQTPSLEEMWQIIQRQQAEIDALKADNEALREQVVEDETAAAATPDILVQEIIVEEVLEPAPANGTVVDIYGHAMLDMGYQVNSNDPDWFDVVRPTKLPSFEGEYGSDGNFFSGVRQSRLGVKSSTPTAYGDLKTIFEFEMFGVGSDAGETTFRLRHAWGELGQFGFGQYWSTFMDIDVFPNSIEYWGPNAMVFYRNVQARWTPWQEGDSRFAISLERPGASGDEGRFADRVELDGIEGDFELPDLAAHYRLAQDWGHVQIAGILRQIQWNDNLDDGFDLSGSETGWGLNLSTNYKIGPHVFRGSIVYGEGIQNYMNDANTDIGVRANFLDPVRPLVGEAIPLLGLVAFLDLNWSEEWTSTIGYSIQDNDLPNGSSDTSFERGQYALANILWHPVPNLFMGPEIQWAKRDNYGPFSADDLRLQFSAKYSFSTTIGGR
jgi:hypothetical protein